MLNGFVFHFPLTDFAVSLLVVGAGIELAARLRRRLDWRALASILLVLGGAAAVFSAASGLWLAGASEHGGAHAEALANHRFLGLATTATALLALMFAAAERREPLAAAGRTVCYVLAAALVIATGLFGGRMAHGGGAQQHHEVGEAHHH